MREVNEARLALADINNCLIAAPQKVSQFVICHRQSMRFAISPAYTLS